MNIMTICMREHNDCNQAATGASGLTAAGQPPTNREYPTSPAALSPSHLPSCRRRAACQGSIAKGECLV